jgi:hypothetical protein
MMDYSLNYAQPQMQDSPRVNLALPYSGKPAFCTHRRSAFSHSSTQQKCSVPVMVCSLTRHSHLSVPATRLLTLLLQVARRRLRRPPRHSAHLAKHRAHIPLAKAGIDRVAPKVDRDVKVMREEIKREEEEEEARHQLRDMEQRVVADVGGVGALEEDIDPEEGEDDPDEDVPPGVKVAG